MFNTEITSKVYELKEMLLNSREYKDTKQAEKIMEEKCSNLLIRYNHLFNEYNEALRFKDYGSDVSGIQKELKKCKIELDKNEYVISYKKAYKEMSKLLKQLEETIFDGIIEYKNINID